MKTLILSATLLMALAGCCKPAVGTSTYDVSGRYLGMSTADLIRIKGAPGSVAVLPTGESVWTYKSLMTVEQPAAAPHQKIDKWVETISFVIDAAGTVKSYTTAIEQ